MVKFHEVCGTQKRTLLAKDNLWVRRNEVCPLPRDGTNGLIVNPQQEPRPGPVMSLAHADEPPPAQRMERMCYAHKARCTDGITCILS